MLFRSVGFQPNLDTGASETGALRAESLMNIRNRIIAVAATTLFVGGIVAVPAATASPTAHVPAVATAVPADIGDDIGSAVDSATSLVSDTLGVADNALGGALPGMW